MEKRVIIVPYADKNGARGGVNVRNAKDRRNIYLKNCCVTLLSAKHHNPDCDVALVTNIDVPQEYSALLERGGVLIWKEPFDRFCFGDQYAWSLAFYKLCALSRVFDTREYDAYCYLDADIYVQRSFTDVWRECKERILLYDTNYHLRVDYYRILLEEAHQLMGEEIGLITHYGGEFFAANREQTAAYLRECHAVYEQMQAQDFTTTQGDEFITSIAAAKLREIVKNASPYVWRFWTGEFYLVSTCYRYELVAALHVLAEKERGLLKLYDRYISHGRMPSDRTAWRLLHLRHKPLDMVLRSTVRKLIIR